MIVDSGINPALSDLSNYLTETLTIRNNEKGRLIFEHNNLITHEHGTALALVIKDICKQIELVSISILDKELSATGYMLLYALRMALKMKPDIIHLSLGTKRIKYYLPLKWLVRTALKKNIKIIAAMDNRGDKCYPAYIKGVISVRQDSFIKGIQPLNPIYEWNGSKIFYQNGIFYGPPHLKEISGAEELKNKNLFGNSIAASYVTGYFAQIMYKEREEKRNGINRQNQTGRNDSNSKLIWTKDSPRGTIEFIRK